MPPQISYSARDFESVQKSLGGPYVANGLTTDAEFTQTLATAQRDLDLNSSLWPQR